jgi:hypothetical protein
MIKQKQYSEKQKIDEQRARELTKVIIYIIYFCTG